MSFVDWEFDVCNPFDITSTDFNKDLYLNKILKECDISKLMEHEQNLYRDIQCLDSEMQTLVYENYNKFINATDTIQKMSSNFDQMEEELNQLINNMNTITLSSEQISKNLKIKRQDLTKLANTHTVLQKLQFLFDLASKMLTATNRKEYADAVNFYQSAVSVLERYEHFSSIANIHEQCKKILNQVILELNEALKCNDLNQNSEQIELLLQLKEDPQKLIDKFFISANSILENILENLQYHTDFLLKSYTKINNFKEDDDEDMVPMDILEYIDLACNQYLSCLNEIVLNCDNIFIKSKKNFFNDEDSKYIEKKLQKFVHSSINIFYKKISYRFEIDKTNLEEINFFIQAIDRFYRRMSSLSNIHSVYINEDPEINSLCLIEDACDVLLNNLFEELKIFFKEQISMCRTVLSVLPEKMEIEKSKNNLSVILNQFENTLNERFKFIIENLINFKNLKLSFYIKNETFREKLCIKIREKIFVTFIKFIFNYIESKFLIKNANCSSQLLLILTKLFYDFECEIINRLIFHLDNEFKLEKDSIYLMTNDFELKKNSKNMAQKLLNQYVYIQGQTLSYLLRKSIESGEWLTTIEPKSVKTIQKRILSDILLIDIEVGQLFEEGNRRTLLVGKHQSFTKNTWSYTQSIDNNLLNNIQKLFTEKIEIFTNCEFNKLSVTTCIIKIVLKTFLECVRLCSFSKYGFQQVQIDVNFLQNQLKKFVTDENLISNLSDEILMSTYQRSYDPVKMENVFVEKICDLT